MRYEKGELQFKGLTFSWGLITTEKDEHGEHEVFNIEIEHKGTKIRQEFHNSISECEISRKLKLNRSFTTSIKELRPKMGGGYDKDLDNKTPLQIKNFDRKRVYWLLYSVINDFSNYIEIEYYSFKDFCDCFGYDEDSKKAEKIYFSCLEYYNKIQSLRLNQEQKEYFLNIVRSEEEDFNKLIKSEIQNQY